MIYDPNSDFDYITVLEPITITDAMLTSSSVPEPDTGDPALWVAANTYAVGDYVRRPNHRVYRAVAAGVDASLPENTPLRWFDDDSTNRWRMLSNKKKTATTATSPFTIVLHPGRVDAMWMKLDATAVSVSIKDAPGGTVVYTNNSSLEASQPDDYYEHWFSPFIPESELMLNNIPPYNDMEMTITATSGSPINFSALLVGNITYLAETVTGCSVKPRNFSPIVVDAQGYNVTKDGPVTKDMTLKGIIPGIQDADFTVDTISRLLTTNCLWSASADPSYTALRSYGIGSAQIDYPEPRMATISIAVQGVLQP